MDEDKSGHHHHLWASSSSLTALSTAFRLLFSSFSTRVASLWSTRATLNISTVSLGATWRAFGPKTARGEMLQETPEAADDTKKNSWSAPSTVPSAASVCTLGACRIWKALWPGTAAPQCSDTCRISSGSSRTVEPKEKKRFTIWQYKKGPTVFTAK